MLLNLCIYVSLLPYIWCAPPQSNDYVTSFVNMVVGNISAADSYVWPTSNVELNDVVHENVIDYGTFDFIIVGAGSAGTVLARRLSEITFWKILLLEAGIEEDDFSDIPGTGALLALTSMNWGYNSTPQASFCLGMNDAICPVVRGKVIGGSSTVNAKIYARGNKEDYNTWQKMGNLGWSYEDVLPYFKKSENFQGTQSNVDWEYHGKGGPLSVNFTAPTPFTPIFLEACRSIGLPILDYNGKHQIGASQAQVNVNGIKAQSGGRAFLDSVRHRPNLYVNTKAFVTKIFIDDVSRIAHGVQFVKNHRKYVATASREVILSAGSFNSPQLLMLSGIGPKNELNKHGIQLIADLPVGENLEDHPAFIGLTFRTNHTVYEGKSTADLVKDYLNGQPPLIQPFNIDCQCFVNVNDETSNVPDIQLAFSGPSGMKGARRKIFNIKDEIMEDADPIRDIHIVVLQISPKSKGRVTVKSSNPLDFPFIDYNLLSEEEDMETMYKGIQKALEIIDTEPFRAVNATLVPVSGICEDYQTLSKEYWYCVIRQLSVHFDHPVGTTRMGLPEHNSVVGSHLLVHTIDQLRVVDAGVMPRIPTGNTNGPTFMIAEKIADEIKRLHLV